MPDRVRHICGISGGKDSSALALYLRRTRPELEVEYFFCDTGAELPETYEYLTKLEAALGQPIARLNADRGFDHWFEVFRGALPSPQMRWCTKNMKIRPIEDWIGDDPAVSYVAIRADESNRKGYVSTKSNISAVFPFIEAGVDHDGVMRILDDAGIGLPSYYEWRTRSGCYFCFYQRKAEWVGLADRHPELFERAKQIERKVLAEAGLAGDASYDDYAMQGRQYTWSQGETLDDLLARRDEIIDRHREAVRRASESGRDLPLVDALNQALDADDDAMPCTVCAL
jgi:3'-phosphoadenosine 5'-phosphosulfate sulfotransferase (PAPS reductase)/FAD synthetase